MLISPKSSCVTINRPVSVNTRHNTLYMLFCFFKLFPMVGKGLITGPITNTDPFTVIALHERL